MNYIRQIALELSVGYLPDPTMANNTMLDFQIGANMLWMVTSTLEENSAVHNWRMEWNE